MIQTINLNKNFGPQHVLGPVDLSISRGQQIALLGASGSGKSTLLNIIGCVDRPSSGELWINERLVSTLGDSELSKKRLHEIGYVHQFFDLISDLSAIENVMLPLWLAKREDPILRAQKLLSELGLGNRCNNLISELSGGEKQRVAIARALVIDPVLILADEPTGSLDSNTGIQVLDLMLSHCAHRNTTLLVATHSAEVARRLPCKIQLSDGKIIENTLANSSANTSQVI